MQEAQVQPLSWEDPLEKETATCSSMLTWEIPWTEERGGLPSRGPHSRARWGNGAPLSGQPSASALPEQEPASRSSTVDFIGKAAHKTTDAVQTRAAQRLAVYHSGVKTSKNTMPSKSAFKIYGKKRVFW